MQLVVFSKALQDRSVEELARLGGEWGVDGFDLAVRPGHPVNPDNMSQALPEAASLLAESGLAIPMVTAGTDMLRPEQPGARELLAAMAEARIGRLKLGYFKFDPVTQDYWVEVDRVRKLAAKADAGKVKLLKIGARAIITTGAMAEYMVEIIGRAGAVNVVTDLEKRWKVKVPPYMLKEA